MSPPSQQRITLKNLKTSELASEETLFFTATVLFDGRPFATARNDGQGGSTFLHPLPTPGSRELLALAEAFAKSLPPETTDFLGPTGMLTIDITLDYLVDSLASDWHTDRRLRRVFKRDLNSKLMFFKGDSLLIVKTKLGAIRDRPAAFERLRARHGADITILQELAPDEAFERWKQYVLGNDSA